MKKEKNDVLFHIDELCERYPSLAAVKEDMARAFRRMAECYECGGKLLIAGNGGSAADAEHIVCELMKGFKKRRRCPDELAGLLEQSSRMYGGFLAERLQGSLPAIALSAQTAFATAYANDVDGAAFFAQQVYGYGRSGDALLVLSTSGNSRNIIYAAVTAKALGLPVIALTGQAVSELSAIADISIMAPETETYKIQEYHLPIYHCICQMLEEYFFSD